MDLPRVLCNAQEIQKTLIWQFSISLHYVTQRTNFFHLMVALRGYHWKTHITLSDVAAPYSRLILYVNCVTTKMIYKENYLVMKTLIWKWLQISMVCPVLLGFPDQKWTVLFCAATFIFFHEARFYLLMHSTQLWCTHWGQEEPKLVYTIFVVSPCTVYDIYVSSQMRQYLYTTR